MGWAELIGLGFGITVQAKPGDDDDSTRRTESKNNKAEREMC